MERASELEQQDTLMIKSPRFISYFTLIIFLILFSIYAVESIVAPDGLLFIEIALLVSGYYFAGFIYNLNKLFVSQN